MKVLCVFGTRPEGIKMMPVVKELQRYPGRIEARVCVTGQHRHMLDQVLKLFDVACDYDLAIMQPNQSLSYITARTLTRLDDVVHRERPDWMLVQGDTTTAMAASLVGFYHRVKVGHVEAGLRTRNKYHPFPEEINRRIADALADLYFAPTEWARQNLREEGIPDAAIRVTGNTVIDALRAIANQPLPSDAEASLLKVALEVEAVSKPETRNPRLILVTAHRRENFGKPLNNICTALKELALSEGSTIKIVYPVHLNPNVQRTVRANLEGTANIYLLPPLSYAPLVHLLKRAYLVLTDSGGLQEEAPSFGVPVLVLRETTERPEAVNAGTARLVGTDPERILSETHRLLHDPEAYRAMAQRSNPFGDGRASLRIVQTLLETNESPQCVQQELTLVSG